MMLKVSLEVERSGDLSYVIERHEGVEGYTRHGPMPRDAAGPFIDDRKEQIENHINSALKARGKRT